MPLPEADPRPAPNAGEYIIEEWADLVRDKYINALKDWGAGLVLKADTCRVGLEAQTTK